MNSGTKRLVFILALSVSLIAILVLIMLKGPLAPVKVQTTQLATSDLQPALFGVGTVEARRRYVIGSTRSGRLQALFVDHGDHVAKGQVLGEIDPVDLPDRLQSAKLSIEKTRHSIEAVEARLSEVKERYTLAKKEAKRYQNLLRQKQISNEVAEAKQSEAIVAGDQLQAAKADLDAARHDLEKLQSDLKAVQAQMAELKLISPADGVIIAREVEPGSVVTAGMPILRLMEPASLWVRTRIEQRDSGVLETGLPAKIYLRTKSNKPLSGHLARLELIADSLSEERWVDIAFAQTPGLVALGTLANVTLILPKVPNTQWIPAAAIQIYQRQTGVWKIVDDKVQFTPVSTGIRTLDGKVQIISGIEPDDLIVHYSSKPLDNDQIIKVHNHD